MTPWNRLRTMLSNALRWLADAITTLAHRVDAPRAESGKVSEVPTWTHVCSAQGLRESSVVGNTPAEVFAGGLASAAAWCLGGPGFEQMQFTPLKERAYWFELRWQMTVRHMDQEAGDVPANVAHLGEFFRRRRLERGE